ncbi:chromatin modification-related protein EAF1 B-like isoform X2 [Silene latifolia]|uniref:chromatin modification-related protein EAF1 B-like isoform X2 n=2 Tax=Silene latifolia TaxID=37657 RepID=UPI003D77C619
MSTLRISNFYNRLYYVIKDINVVISALAYVRKKMGYLDLSEEGSTRSQMFFQICVWDSGLNNNKFLTPNSQMAEISPDSLGNEKLPLIVFLRGMHGFNSGSTLIVNAEVDSMGGIVDGGVDIDTNPSPRQAAIEKAQAELRVEYDVREERRRELEFLEKGGDPLDFKFGRAASVSVQSTSNTDQHQDINLTSEAKGSFALTASPHGDSVESNGRLGVTTACEQNSADNFDGENEILQNDRKLMHSGRSSITPLEHSQRDGCRDVKDSEDSPIFHPKKGQAYRRRNRFRTNRDGPRSSSADMTSCGGHASSTPARHVALSKSVASENPFEIESDGTHAIHSSLSRVADVAQGKLSLSKSEEKLDEVHHLSLKVDEVPVALKIVEADTAVGRNSVDTVDAGCPPSGAGTTENNASSPELHETGVINGDKCTPTDALVKNAPVMMKGLDSESSCTQTNVRVDGNENIDSDLCTNLKNVDSNGAPKGSTLSVGENSVSKDDKLPSEELVTSAMKAFCNEDKTSVSLQGNGFNEDCAEVVRDKSSLQDEVNGISKVEAQEEHNATMLKSESEREQRDSCISKMERSFPMTSLMDPASNEVNKGCVSGSSPVLDSQPSTENQPKTLDKAQEDRILEEARMIEAKHKRIAELSVSVLAREHRHRCHWDLVLEEMAWLSNDFAQERVWKMTAAAQICRRVALASRKRWEEQSKFSKQKGVAHTLAKAVMEFWHSASLFVENVDSPLTEKCKHEVSSGAHEMNKASQDVLQSTRRKQDHAVYGYAVRFLQCNRSPKPVLDGEVPGFANVPFDIDLPDVSWEDQFTEENLFYAVPPGAMEMYRTSIMSHLAGCERIGKNNHEEGDISGHDAAECGYEDNGYEEDEGENLYYLPGAIDTGKPSKKKRKNRKSYEARSYEYGGDVGYGHCSETRNGTPQLNVTLKRPTSSLHVDPIPTKRIRTASRQRVVGPFGAASAGFAPVLSRADASSGDTNSFQDDLSTLHGVSVVPRGSEVDSAMNFEKQTTFDSAEMPAKSKKKKKIKHSSVSYDQRWQLDSSMQNEQKDLVRKRVDHQLESNGNVLYGQHAKKPKLAKHLLENSFDNSAPMSGSVASPVASQMSNMSSQTKIIKFIGSRDRGKKGKGLKVSTGQHGLGGPWTIVEDQALVVLVHDMGPNWELVSDAINNILQFKCIFRKPQECKERHKFLMDRPSGDGADSAEDSGSSQPYPSTLPGIPKGSARQLFRSLHAHVEEDNIKSRFEKIIHIEQQSHFRKKKNDIQDLKQRAPIHSSHVLSLSQVIPNNLNGGVLTPLDLCDMATSNQDPLSTMYQQPNGLQLSGQNSIPSIHSPGGPSPSQQGLQGSPSMGIGSNLTPPSSQYTGSRDARYSVPRSGSLPIEEQQRLTQHNSMLPGRNAQASTLSSSGSLSGSDRGMRMHPGGNGVGIMPGMNRSIPMARPGVQGIPSSSMLNSGSVLASNMGGMRGSMTPHSGIASGHGNTMFRPRDSLHGVRSGQSSEHQRQVVSPEMQIQTTQTNSAGVLPFGGLSSGFSTQIDSPPLPPYPGHPHVLGTPHPHLPTSNHSATPEQQAYLRMARERQIQQRLLQRQHQLQHPASSMTHQQPSVPLPSLSSAPPATQVSPVPHQQQKNLQGHGRSSQSAPGGVLNQGAKQRQRPAQQQYQQSGRQHPQQRQQSQSQQAKLAKGIGNIPIDPSHINGLSANTASQVAENIHSPSSNHTQPQKPYVNVAPATSKPVQQISSHLDGGNQGQGLCSNQGSSSTHSRNHQQFQGQSAAKAVNQPQPALQRSTQQSLAHSDFLTKSQVDHSQSYQKSCDVGPPSAVAASSPSSNVVRKVQDPICESAMTGASSSSGPSSSKDVTNSLGNSLQHESRKQQQESQLQAPSREPVLQQKQSQHQLQQLEQPLQRVPQSQSQPQIQDGQNVAFTRTSNSRLD